MQEPLRASPSSSVTISTGLPVVLAAIFLIQAPLTSWGTLVSAARGPFHQSHLLVLTVDTLDRGTYDLAVPLSQVRWVRLATLRGTLDLTGPPDETEEDERP